MSNSKQTERATPGSCETLLHILEALPGALFVIDGTEKIVYANASAQAMPGATPEALVGNSFWRGAPHLVNTTLYQAVRKARQTQEPTEVEYISPVTQNWLHVQLVPTAGGLVLHFHEKRALTRRQETSSPDEHLAADVLENMYVGVGFLTPEGILLDINEAPLADAQVRREEVIGQPFAQTPWWTFYPASQDQLRAAITRASRGETVRFETLVHPREGMDLHLEATITPHRDVDHHVEYLVYVGTDITARKRAEGEIRALIDAIPQLVWTGRPDGYVDFYNQRWRDYTGLSTEEVEGEGWMQCTYPEDRQRVLETWQRAVQTGRPYEAEQRLRHGTTGEYRWFLMQATPYTDAQGTILKYVGTCTDIHDKKQAEDEIRVLANAIPQIVWMMRPDGSCEYCNQRWRDYTNMTSEQSQGDGWLQAIHPDDQQRVLERWQRAVQTGRPYEAEQRLRHGTTREYRWFLVRGVPHRDDQGTILKWFGTATDIEEQKLTEEALRQSQERASVLMNSNIIGIFVDEGDRIVAANDTFLRMTGYTQEDLREGRMNWLHMTPPDYLDRTLEAHQELASKQSITPYEKEYVCKDGSRLPVLVGGVILQHHPSQAIGFVLDNTARKELEQRKDDFISMASHELRNPLATLKLQTILLHRQLARQGTLAPALSSMQTQINTLTRLVEDLLDVSKIQAGRLGYVQETVDLDALLREIVDTMQQTHPSHRILMRGAVQTNLLGDRDRLEQVFTNLISNAIKYSPGAETVEMDLSTSPESATIRVRDHGLGIPRELRDKIFDRFYRVTDPKQMAIPGLGMGLYIVSEIIKGHGGTITVDSDVGKGSTFTVTLPLKRDA
ncbi:PAS domain S-box protein [Ktedonobacter robiniae]|uniref:histidine kinase n=1 Tax=Ktedonobacter robiniae TaxID=2778365 RepID=A0ABQ3UV60_9CHLR|nr:PAS domain S-box protein [Ktedonobacter robiniae]GHO56706.1 hypothetical protein KSB_51810 [Ktedonobacter robiniae]